MSKSLPLPTPNLSNSIWDRLSLKGKVAVVTGGARGIGYAIADCYSQAGADVALMDIDIEAAQESCDELRTSYGNNVLAYHVDVSSLDQVERAITEIEESFGTVDVFVAHAGIVWTHGAILDEQNEILGPERWRRLIDTDLNAVYYCAKTVGKLFRRQESGSLIITASLSGHFVNLSSYQTCYSAAKAGCLRMGKALAAEWAGFARVNTVSPGYVNVGFDGIVPTEVRKEWWKRIPMHREALPEELVGAYLYLASDASTYTTGSDIKVDGGYGSLNQFE